MASATKQSVTRETITGVTLDLTLEEARTLAVVLSRVGGSPRISPREHIEAVSNALSDVGVNWLSASERGLIEDSPRYQSIMFNNYPVLEG